MTRTAPAPAAAPATLPTNGHPMNIAARMVRDWRMVAAVLANCYILALFTIARPDVDGGQFLSGLAIGLTVLVLTIGYYRALPGGRLPTTTAAPARHAARQR